MRCTRLLPLGALALLAGATGCITHNYYPLPVYNSSGQAAATTVRYGDVCEVPTVIEGGTVVSQAPGRVSVLTTAPGPVLVSEARGIPIRRSRPRLSWKTADPEGLATTQVEGSIDAETTTR